MIPLVLSPPKEKESQVETTNRFGELSGGITQLYFHPPKGKCMGSIRGFRGRGTQYNWQLLASFK